MIIRLVLHHHEFVVASIHSLTSPYSVPPFRLCYQQSVLSMYGIIISNSAETESGWYKYHKEEQRQRHCNPVEDLIRWTKERKMLHLRQPAAESWHNLHIQHTIFACKGTFVSVYTARESPSFLLVQFYWFCLWAALFYLVCVCVSLHIHWNEMHYLCV